MFHVKQSPLLTITLPDVCPPSWNKFYAGMHWAERKRIADEAHSLIRCYLPFGWQPITIPVAIRYDAYQVRPQTHYSAHTVWFATRAEAQAWIDGKPTSTQAPALAAVVWAKPNERGDRDGELQAIQLFIDEYDMAPEWRRQ